MLERREEFLLEIETKLLGLTVKDLRRVCEYCKIAGKNSEDVKHKTCCALIKHIVKFCECNELLEREDEGMSVHVFGVERHTQHSAGEPDRGRRCGSGATRLFT